MTKAKLLRDFRKRKAKVGKKLQKTNETNLSFKSKKVTLSEQNLDIGGQSLVERMKSHCSHLKHHKFEIFPLLFQSHVCF